MEKGKKVDEGVVIVEREWDSGMLLEEDMGLEGGEGKIKVEVDKMREGGEDGRMMVG